MLPQRFVMPYVQWQLPTGVPAIGAGLSFYVSGTSTPATVYADAAGTTPLVQPVLCSAGGYWPAIFLSSAINYKVVLLNADLTPIWTADPLTGVSATQVPVTAAQGLLIGQNYRFFSYASGFTVTLPALSTIFSGQGMWISTDAFTATNNVTIAAAGTDLIDQGNVFANNLLCNFSGDRFGLFYFSSNGAWNVE